MMRLVDSYEAYCALEAVERTAQRVVAAAQILGARELSVILPGDEPAEVEEADLSEPAVPLPVKRKMGPRYTPVSRRQDRPNAILWLVRNHPELKDAQVIRLLGTTKTTIQAIRDQTHWNAANLTPIDPVALGLCSQLELDREVQWAMRNRPAVAALSDDELDPDTVLAKLRGTGDDEAPAPENDDPAKMH